MSPADSGPRYNASKRARYAANKRKARRPESAESRAAFLWGLLTPEQILSAATTPSLRRVAAEKLGVSLRTVQRYQSRFSLCPGPRCMTLVRGGGLCGFCKRSWGL